MNKFYQLRSKALNSPSALVKFVSTFYGESFLHIGPNSYELTLRQNKRELRYRGSLPEILDRVESNHTINITQGRS